MIILSGGGKADTEVVELYRAMGSAYRRMIDTVNAWQKLTTPAELQGEELPEDLLTLNISIPKSKSASVAVLSDATGLLNDLYEAIAVAYDKKVDSALVVVKVESGSSIRVDCKGLGDVVRHVKEFLLEAWHKVRHKRAEEVIENNKALLSSLGIIDHINSRVTHRGLSPEEGELLRRRVLKDALGLFECGALIAEIPAEESVDNTRLLVGFSPKLLPAPTKPSGKPTSKRPTRKRTQSKKKETRKASSGKT